MRELKRKFGRKVARGPKVALCLALVCFAGASLAKAQSSSRSQGPESNSRLLTAEEGRAIVDTVLAQDQPVSSAQDCSHLLQQIYLRAGFAYPYASSFDLYAGNESFERVRNPRPGDLIAWPGHVGIVLEPVEHSFYSLVNTGLETQNYEGPYWKSRGRPRFYRYRVENGGVLNAVKGPASLKASNSDKRQDTDAVIEERSGAEVPVSHLPPKTASERTRIGHGLPAAPAPGVAGTALEVPQSIVIAAGNKPPTKDAVAQGISELSNASGNVLSADDPSNLKLPVVIFERLSVERLEIKRNRGWAHLQIDSRATIARGEADYKWRREKVRWELRRTEMGWEAIAPADRTYVPQDVAVRNLAAQLARLTDGDGAGLHREIVLEKESQLANLLSRLLERK
jgi:NlpC/P60 family protein